MGAGCDARDLGPKVVRLVTRVRWVSNNLKKQNDLSPDPIISKFRNVHLPEHQVVRLKIS